MMLGVFLSFVASRILYLALHLESSSFPKPLSEREEKEAFAQLKEGSAKAIDTLISHNLRLAAHIAKKYYTTNCSQEDIVSIGTIGLIKAVNSFDPTKGRRFATYAARCIENEILMYFRSGKKEQPCISIYDSIDKDQSGTELTINDVIADAFALDEDYEDKEEVKNLYAMLDSLSARERRIIVLRYGLYGQAPLTQQETCEALQISRSYVSRLEKKALEQLKGSFGDARKNT
jgi:RNA polymerase sporulation-specific sigma factor